MWKLHDKLGDEILDPALGNGRIDDFLDRALQCRIGADRSESAPMLWRYTVDDFLELRWLLDQTYYKLAELISGPCGHNSPRFTRSGREWLLVRSADLHPGGLLGLLL